MTKTILVTGGAGFIGCHLCEYLLQTNDENIVVCIDNIITGSIANIQPLIQNYPNRFHFFIVDICKPDELLILSFFKQIHEIYHLASIASPEKYKMYPLETLNTNVIGTINILNLCVKQKAKMVFTSTSEVYGDPLEHPQNENYFGNVNMLGERSCYDEGKRVAETYIYEYRKKYDIDVKIVRLFNTYGPKMNIEDGRVITNFIRSILNNEPVTIYGSGAQTRSFCYINDTVSGIVKMMKSDNFGPINIGNPYNELTIYGLIDYFQKISVNRFEIKYCEKSENDPMVRRPDITKAIQLLDWTPRVELFDGLKVTFEYFQNTILRI
jgi:UDP-glucuronate decarboxylase